MRNLHAEPGRLYDTVTFLTRYFGGNSGSGTDADREKNRYYNIILARLVETETEPSPILYPFLCRYKDRRPFLDLLLLSGSYRKLSCSQAAVILGNDQYMRNRFVEYYFSGMNTREVLKTLEEHPGGIELITNMAFPPSLETRIYYTLIHFRDVLKTLGKTVAALGSVLESEQQSFLDQNPNFARELSSAAPNSEKLKILTKLSDAGAPNFSFSLLDPYIISFRDNDPGFILLGCDYDEILHARYRYKTADPYAFAQAIGTPVRYEIYQALLEQPLMTRADMERKLHLSRAALDHNLKVMRENGLLIIDHQTGPTNHYRLDPEYLRVVAGLILERARV